LSINWAARRGGYRRKFTPLLDGFVSETPEAVGPPTELVTIRRSTRQARLNRLRAWRADVARSGGILPDAVLTDRTLATIAEHQPATAEELDRATGVGRITAGRLFDGISAAIADR
jgi:superfamily II DNA helicase RecQ